MKSDVWTSRAGDRKHFIGGSDARIIMGSDDGCGGRNAAKPSPKTEKVATMIDEKLMLISARRCRGPADGRRPGPGLEARRVGAINIRRPAGCP